MPMHSQGNDNSTTKATLTEGKITLNKDSTPTQTTAKALGINTELSQAHREVEQPKDINQVLKEQQTVSQSVGHMASAANIYASQKAQEAAEAVKQAEAELQAAEKEKNLAKIKEKRTAYLEAKATQESWGENGSNKRKVDAAVATIGTILSGGSAGQTAVAALSPELNAQIHELTKDSKTANLLAHAALSALEAKVSGTSATAGAISGVAGEATAMLLAETVFNKQPSELTAEEKNLLKVAGQLVGAVAGQASGGTTADTVFGAETANRAVENNYLSADKAKERFEIENRIKLGIATEADLARKQVLDIEDIVNDQKVIIACKSDITSDGCQNAVTEALAIQQGYHKGYPNETWRSYSNILASDYNKFNKLLYDKTGIALEFEQRAQLVAKGKGISIEEARTQIQYLDRYHMVMGGLATFVGAKHLPNSAALKTQLEAKPKLKTEGDKPDYRTDVGSLGVNNSKYNKDLNKSINNRNSEHYINEQASKRVNTVTVPINFDGHIINGEVKGKRVTGGHSTLGNVRVDEVLETYPNGVYQAKISVLNPNTGEYKAKTNGKGESTMFPRNWTADRIKVEVQHAYDNRYEFINTHGQRQWRGETISGVKVEGFLDGNVTVYPLKGQ